MAATLDTLAIAKEFTAAGFPARQAEALAVALRQAQDVDFSSVATKADLAETRADIYKVMLAQTVVIIGAVVGLLKMGGH
jgi:hypothetical protein